MQSPYTLYRFVNVIFILLKSKVFVNRNGRSLYGTIQTFIFILHKKCRFFLSFVCDIIEVPYISEVLTIEKYIAEIERLVSELDEKRFKKLQIQTLLNLIRKISEKQNEEIDQMLSNIVLYLQDVNHIESFQRHAYERQFSALKKTVRNTYGYVAKGDIPNEKMAIGIGIGVAIGAGLMSVNSAFIGAGIAIGVAVGLSLGSAQEKKEEENGNIY